MEKLEILSNKYDFKWSHYINPDGDFVIHVRQPKMDNPIYQVLMEDAYGNSSAEMMTPSKLWEKFKIKL